MTGFWLRTVVWFLYFGMFAFLAVAAILTLLGTYAVVTWLAGVSL